MEAWLEYEDALNYLQGTQAVGVVIDSAKDNLCKIRV